MAAEEKRKVFLGDFVHTNCRNDLSIIRNGFMIINEYGKIVDIGTNYKEWYKRFSDFISTAVVVQLNENQFLMPGFVDCHIHAPQFAQIGLGLDLPLLEWLDKYTFPLEAQFNDLEFAQKVYKRVVEATIKEGTTLASYFGTNNTESTLILADQVCCQGQRAFVGKVCTDCNAPENYAETTDDSVNQTIEFVTQMEKKKLDLVEPIITPRFAVSCSKRLLKELGKIAKERNLRIQSHICENNAEIDFVRRTFKKSYAQVYEAAGLLTKKTIMAHAVHLEDDEVTLLKSYRTSVAHCPSSNTNLNSGLCDVKRLLDNGIKVGLGTDVSGGNSVSIKDVMLRALDVSKHLAFLKTQGIQGTPTIHMPNPNYKALNLKQVFYLATLGGAEALDMQHVTGNFEKGKQFDALIIDVSINSPLFRPLTVEERVEKFIYTGDDRNIISVYINGILVKGK